MKVYIDTNILVDFICRRDTFFEPAKALFATGYIGKVKLVISSVSILNAVYIGRKYGSIQIKSKLESLSHFVEIIDLTSDTVISELTSDWKDYEDAVQHKSAIKVNADCIVTRNNPDFSLSSIPVYTVEEILKLCENI
ncbi:MAG: PIN domain-containing protein [Prevotella sp.]|nr:PIN domain-containing protein [Prevotella sp.]